MYVVECPVLLHAPLPRSRLALLAVGSGPHRDLHSFPTRRSSDRPGRRGAIRGGARPCPARGAPPCPVARAAAARRPCAPPGDRKSTRLNSSHTVNSYAVFCLKKNKKLINSQ